MGAFLQTRDLDDAVRIPETGFNAPRNEGTSGSRLLVRARNGVLNSRAQRVKEACGKPETKDVNHEKHLRQSQQTMATLRFPPENLMQTILKLDSQHEPWFFGRLYAEARELLAGFVERMRTALPGVPAGLHEAPEEVLGNARQVVDGQRLRLRFPRLILTPPARRALHGGGTAPAREARRECAVRPLRAEEAPQGAGESPSEHLGGGRCCGGYAAQSIRGP